MAEVLVGIILCRVTHLAGLAINLDEGVLSPPPCRHTIVLQDEVPVVVFVTSVSKIVGQEEECVFAGSPIHASIAALAFRLHETKIRIAFAQLW